MSGPQGNPSEEQRVPKEHGVSVSEVVDLDGPVARITRTTYVGSQWTKLVVMVPSDPLHDLPNAQCVEISFSAETLKRFLEALKWPVT